MNILNIKPETIREYLLGRISDEKTLEEIEEFLFTNEDFCTQAELIEDELINEYTFGRLTAEDTKSFEEKLKTNPDLKLKTQLTRSLKEKANVEVAIEKISHFDSIREFLRQPIYAGAFAIFLIAVLISAIYFLIPKDSNELAQLEEIYKTERPFETRISEFGYAPYVAERSEKINEENKNKLRLIENKLLEAVETNPTAENRHALGVFYLTQKKFEDSIRELKKATELDEKNPTYRNDLGSAYFEFAKNNNKEKIFENITNANEEFSKALELNDNFLEALFNKSMTLEELNLPRRAKESWEDYLKKDSTSKWAGEARNRLERLNQKEISEKTDEQVLDAFLNAYRAKNFQKAIQIHDETKGTLKTVTIPFQLTNRYLLAKEEPDPGKAKESIEALRYIGVVERDKHSDFFVSELAEFYENINKNQIEGLLNAKRLFGEGYDSIKKSKYEESIEKYEQSKKLYLENGNDVEANYAEIWIGQMLPATGNIEKSQIRLKDLVNQVEKRKFKVFIPTAYYWLSVGSFSQKKFSEAINTTKKGLDVAEETNNLFEIQHSAQSIAKSYELLGELRKALGYLRRAEIDQNAFYANMPQVSRHLMNIAELNAKLENNSTAVEFAKESLTLSRKLLSKTEMIKDSLRSLTKALTQKGRYEEALKYANESNQIALNKEQTPNNLKVIAETFLELADIKSQMQHCPEALQDYEKSLEYYRRTPEFKYFLYNIYKGKLLCFQKLQRQEDFENELQRILQVSEEYRREIREDESRQAFFDSEQVVFDVAISDALKKNDAQKAFQFSEMSKARSLLDYVQSKNSIFENEAETSETAKPLNIEEIQTRMPENVQIVQYSLREGKLAIWTFSKTRFDLTEKKVSILEFEKKIKNYRNSILAKKGNGNLKPIAQEFYKLLIPKDLEKDKIICFIPDKSLHQIPFASLVSSEEKYLIEDFAILYSPSASVFVLASENAKKKSQTEESLLIIGNPQFDREKNPNLTDLPNAEIEAETISKHYQKSQKFIGQKATKDNFLNQFEKAEIIHFAGHFVANGQSPRNSKFIFTDENFHSFEFSDKKLPKSKLVVLSACETAFEKFNKSEGTIGIGRTFLALGTPVVIASNWKVDSETTKDLMISFHQKRQQQGFSTIEALRQAQIEIIKKVDKNSPFFWSAFSTIGGFSIY